ncbi:MAG: glycosyltransferase family 4 protein, partial [Firmicutes bacterium]|nr:glycosyltransferase family 4 protein [Bacillota bacterium]
MSKIMVFDVAAESGGALSVLNGFYKEFKENLDNEYIIVVSRPHLSDAANIKVLRYPWVKRSWGHRLYFDNFIAPDLIRKNEVGKVLSLQNIIIPHTRIDQTVLVHNALPFIEYKFSILEDPLLWSYQNVIGRMIFRSIKKATKVIVQTEWMKNACVKRLNIDPVKLEVLPAKINIEVKNRFKPTKESLSTFFYPASGALFKNHRLIIEACRELKHQGIENYTVLFTLKGDENRHIGKLYKSVAANQLPVKFIGSLSRKEVFDYYSKSILIFPSYIESFALPLHEAMAHGAPILATKQLLSREVLG